MSWLGSIFSAASSTISGFSIGTWLKIAGVVVVAVVIGGLYWWGSHESSLNTTLTEKTGAQAQVIADDQKNLTAYAKANQDWANAFVQYQKESQAQSHATQTAQAAEEKANEDLKHLEADLRSNPAGTVARLNADNDELVCMLRQSTGGPNCHAVGASGASGAAAPGSR